MGVTMKFLQAPLALLLSMLFTFHRHAVVASLSLGHVHGLLGLRGRRAAKLAPAATE